MKSLRRPSFFIFTGPGGKVMTPLPAPRIRYCNEWMGHEKLTFLQTKLGVQSTSRMVPEKSTLKALTIMFKISFWFSYHLLV